MPPLADKWIQLWSSVLPHVLQRCPFAFSAEPPLLAHGAPFITTGIGQSLSIPCMLLDGIPLPERHWTRDGTPVRWGIVHSEEHESTCGCVCVCVAGRRTVVVMVHCDVIPQVEASVRTFLRSDGSLNIERARPEDAGVYVCSAVNVAGSMNISVSLEVHGEALGALGLSVWEIGSLSVVAVVMFLMGDVLCLHR